MCGEEYQQNSERSDRNNEIRSDLENEIELIKYKPMFSPLRQHFGWCVDVVPWQDQSLSLDQEVFGFPFGSDADNGPLLSNLKNTAASISVSFSSKRGSPPPRRGLVKARIFYEFVSRVLTILTSSLPPRRGLVKARIFYKFVSRILTILTSKPLAPTQPILQERMTQALQCFIELDTEPVLAQPARSPPHHDIESNGGELMQLVLSEQVSLAEFGATNYGGNVVSAFQSYTAITQSEKKHTIETLERKRGRNESLVGSDDQQHFGWEHVDSAKSLGVVASMMKRHRRQDGIPWCPFHKNVENNSSFKLNLVTESVGCMEGAIRPTFLSTHSLPGAVECSRPSSPSCKHCEHPEEKNISSTCKTTSSDQLVEIGNQVLGSSLSSHEEVLQDQNGNLPAPGRGSNKSKIVNGSEEDNMDLCHGNDPVSNLCGSFTHRESLEARDSPELTFQPTELTSTTVYSTSSTLVFPKPQTDLGGILSEDVGNSNDSRYLFPSAGEGEIIESIQRELPHVTRRKNARIVTTSQKEAENSMTAPCWGSASELEVISPSLLAPTQPSLLAEKRMTRSLQCLTESTAQHNLGQGCLLEEERSVAIINPSMDKKLESTTRCIQTTQPATSSLHLEAFSNGEDNMQLDSSESQSLDATNTRGKVVNADESCTAISHPEKKNTIGTRKPKCGTAKDIISFEDILQLSHLKRKEAACRLGVHVSTFKRLCRHYEIFRWDHPNISKAKLAIESVQGVVGAFISPTTSSHTDAVDVGSNYQNSQGSKPPRPQREKMSGSCNKPSIGGQDDIASQMLENNLSAHKGQLQEQNRSHLQRKEVGNVTIMATYGEHHVIVPASATSGVVELKKELAKRLELEHGSFDVKYQHEYLDCILLIACDDALRECLTSSTSRGKQVVRLLVLDKVVNSKNSGKTVEHSRGKYL